jgi:hypothetical protein
MRCLCEIEKNSLIFSFLVRGPIRIRKVKMLQQSYDIEGQCHELDIVQRIQKF